MTLPLLGLDADDLATLLAILQKYAPEAEVWAFGSRVRGTARPFSDLDIVLIGQNRLPAETRAELLYALSESRLPIRIDIVEWARTAPTFRELIQRDHVVLKTKAA